MAMHDTGTANTSTSHTYTPDRRISTETKASYKTTELAVYIFGVLGVLIASLIVDEGASDFGAEEAWFYVTLLTIGYMISRGLAKSGTREHYDDSTGSNSGQGSHDRH
ncbi:hypothetical protein SFC88_15430 [Nocardioides sp. HM23]|uniref:hypothetical protein n=1 Tax=Nocardioides bizhenqiangii TaxID=3095076 RepID=UPI002ACA7EB0|nr:hypothetical protein [Nocardioides sp. HM23]MDZ5622236.1 hypothetical protein [Nocardioides sp. HM23]